MLKSDFLKPNPVKLKFSKSSWLKHLRTLATLTVATLAYLPGTASAQADFTLQAAAFAPYAVDPGGTAAANLTLGTLNGFTGTVALACTVAPVQTAFTPMCTVSPATVTPSAGATATVVTSFTNPGGVSPPALYTVTITGTGPSTTHSVQENLTVLAVTPAFTITVGTAVAPSSVHAGSGGTGVVDVNPINGYVGTVTLACTSVTPIVVVPPLCSFNPASVMVNGTQTTSTITITTLGTTTTGAAAHTRLSYALWLPFPLMAILAAGVSGNKRARGAAVTLMLFTAVAALVIMPACGGSNSSTTTSSTGVTPNNTYSFTVTGVDSNGVSSSNTTSTSVPTVSLTVN
jgi:hypothetical protein